MSEIFPLLAADIQEIVPFRVRQPSKCLKETKKQGQLVGQQQKVLQLFHLASFMTFENENGIN